MRSKLLLPCSRPELFAKALAGEADALSFDLEDAVPEAGKGAARQVLAEVLRSDAVRASAKTIIVRVNAPATAHFVADVAALAHCRIVWSICPRPNALPISTTPSPPSTRRA